VAQAGQRSGTREVLLQDPDVGGFVLLFLVILWVFTWLLGREYNKAVR